MNNIFEISGDEIKRILSLHEESTKQQYLNVINEQSKDTYTTTQDHSSYMYIPKGTKFSKGGNGVLTTFTNGFRMYYNCNGKFYIVKGDNQKQYDPGLTKELANFCLSQRSINKTQQTKTTPDQSKPQQTTTQKPVVKQTTKSPIQQKSNQSKTQQPQLTDQQKLDKAKKCGYNSWDEYKNNNWVCKTQTTQQKPVTKQTTQQFAQQVTNYNKTIQTSLGSQKPTGQITDADLDNILAKLG